MFHILLLILPLLNVDVGCCGNQYKIPEPKFELLYPRGFSVKIPHSDGISIFAFHGNINEELDFLEAGQFSKDISKRTGDYWIFEDRTCRLKVGDRINFWLFVIKDKLGYRYDDGEYTITGKLVYLNIFYTQKTHTKNYTSSKLYKTIMMNYCMFTC